jgi:cytochrome d ubiquinol oxidase subunit II
MFCIHGALWLAVRTSGDMKEKAFNTARKLWPLFLIVVVAFLIYSFFGTALFANYLASPILFLLLLVAVLGLLAVRFFIGAVKAVQAWISSAVTIVCVTFFGLVGIFPALLPSSLQKDWSLTAYNASSSHLTLSIMLGVAIVFVPIVIIYQAWVYKNFSHTITDADLEYDEAY